MVAMWAEMMSLSPKRISAKETVSFSFTTGTTPKLHRVKMVFLMLR